MTYLIVGNKEKNIKEGIEILLKKLWGRDINEDLFSGKIPDIHILSRILPLKRSVARFQIYTFYPVRMLKVLE